MLNGPGIKANLQFLKHGHNTASALVLSRNSENMTPKYPDIVARLPGCLAPGTESCVLDGEAVGWDPENKRILPFQVRVVTHAHMRP